MGCRKVWKGIVRFVHVAQKFGRQKGEAGDKAETNERRLKASFDPDMGGSCETKGRFLFRSFQAAKESSILWEIVRDTLKKLLPRNLGGTQVEIHDDNNKIYYPAKAFPRYLGKQVNRIKRRQSNEMIITNHHGNAPSTAIRHVFPRGNRLQN